MQIKAKQCKLRLIKPIPRTETLGKHRRRLKRADRRKEFLLSPHSPFRISAFCFLLSVLSNAEPCAARPSNADSPTGILPEHEPMSLLRSLAERWVPAAINMA